MNKRHLMILAVALGLAAPFAQAGHKGHRHAPAWSPAPHYHVVPHRGAVRARVVHVYPVMERVRYERPVRECWQGRCRVRIHARYDERIVGYRVAWAHRGQQGIVQMPYRPGSYVTVAVGIHR